LEPGDTFYLFSDGFWDQFGGSKGNKFKTANFKKLLVELSSLPTEEIGLNRLSAIADRMQGFEQVDDICVIRVRV
jgi:serine phosphatase RsbU (regulator of sigma subunit)